MNPSDSGTWVIVTAEGSAGTAVYRVRTDQPHDSQVYPINVCVRYPYAGDPRGFPTATEQGALDAFEDRLSELMWPPGPSCLVLSITGFQTKEWQFQAKTFGEFITHFNRIFTGQPKLPLTIEYSDDPGWLLWHSVRDRAVGDDTRVDS